MKKVLYYMFIALMLVVIPADKAFSLQTEIPHSSTQEDKLCIVMPVDVIEDIEKQGGMLNSKIFWQAAFKLANELEPGIKEFRLSIEGINMCVRHPPREEVADVFLGPLI